MLILYEIESKSVFPVHILVSPWYRALTEAPEPLLRLGETDLSLAPDFGKAWRVSNLKVNNG